jgi:release factor glutamine methyltransferase
VSEAGRTGPDTVTWRQLWAETAEAVGDRHRARWLCEVASASVDGDEFLARLDEPATVRMVAHLDAMVARHRAGEPLQYVLGEWSFRHLTLSVDRRVLIPRPETELVAEVALGIAAQCAPTRIVVDLGTGSGAIGLSLADELPREGTEVWLTDASADAIDVARANLAGIGPAAANVRIAQGSWFEALPPGLVCDVIVSNPPYVAVGSDDLDDSVVEWEPPSALFAGADGLDDIRILAAGAPEWLRPGGALVLEIGADQGRAVSEVLGRAGLVDVEIRADLSGRDRIAVARRPA